MTTNATIRSQVEALESDDEYPAFERLVSRRLAGANGPLFTTNPVYSLSESYLAQLPTDRRQHYNCRACRRFIDSYGTLVRIEPSGEAVSVLWGGDLSEVPGIFRESVDVMNRLVRSSAVTGVFVSPEVTLGLPSNVPGPGSKYEGKLWSHLCGPNPEIYKPGGRFSGKTAEQAAAEYQEDFGLLARSLAQIRIDVLREAVRVLEAEALSRSEKGVGSARWMLTLKESLESVRNHRHRTNLVWLAAATAPPGFCHIKNTVVGTLIQDIEDGLSFEEVTARWSKKMNPLQYQRKTTLTTGHLEAAEKVIARLGAEKSLDRRYARLDEVVALWRPRPPINPPAVVQSGGVFAHLRSKARGGQPELKPLDLPPKTMTWVMFKEQVLPGAAALALWVGSGRKAFYGLVTAAHPEAPPILQWDDPTLRNPVSWYYHVRANGLFGQLFGSTADEFGLVQNSWVPVTALSYKPPHWHTPDRFLHEGWGIMLALAGCGEINEMRGGGLFIESLRSEYREARAAIEAHMREAVIGGRAEGNANGICFEKESPHLWDCRLRVTDSGGRITEYRLDRWA